MATNGGKIQIGVSLKYERADADKIISDLNRIAAMTQGNFLKLHPELEGTDKVESELKKLQQTASDLRVAFQRSLNMETGVVNIQKLNAQLKNIDVSRIKQAGAQGEIAFNNMYRAALTTHNQVKKVQTVFDKMGVTLANTIKWGISSSIMNNFTGAVQQAYGYVKNLDTSLNDIRIVTGKSAEEMERFAVQANSAAKSLGKTTNDYTKASLIYYQQGLSDEEVEARTNVTLKAANVTGQTASEVSEQLTAVWNGYKVSAEETEVYVDKLAKVAATTAADLEELSTGMSKVASAANIMGVDVDQLNAQLATIISVTREAPETIGTSLKTVYARMATIKAGGIDEEDGATLTSYTEKMNQLGINVLDSNNKLRDMGDVIEEIGGKWASMSREQQVSLAQTIAGTRQYSRMMSLFDNWDMYEEALNTSANSLGTLQEQQDIYMDSMEAHLNTLTAQWEDLYDSILDEDGLKVLIDGFTGVLSVITKIIDSLGGSGGLIGLLGMVGAKALSKNVGTTVAAKFNEADQARRYKQTMRQRREAVRDDGTKQYTTEGQAAMEKATNKYANYIDILPEDMIKSAEEAVDKIGDSYNKRAALEEQSEKLVQKEVEIKENIVKEQEKIFQNEAEQGKLEEQIKQSDKNIEELKNKQKNSIKNLDDSDVRKKELQKTMTKFKAPVQSLSQMNQGNTLNQSMVQKWGQFKNLYDSKIVNKPFWNIDMEDVTKLESLASGFKQNIDNYIKGSSLGTGNQKNVQSVQNYLRDAARTTGLSDNDVKKFEDQLKKEKITAEETQEIYKKIEAKLQDRSKQYEKLIEQAEELKRIEEDIDKENADKLKEEQQKNKDLKQQKEEKEKEKETSENNIQDLEDQQKNNEDAQHQNEEAQETIRQQIEELENESAVITAAISAEFGAMAQGAMDVVGGLGSMFMGVQALKGAIQTLQSDDLSFFDKISQVSMSLAMALPSIVSGIDGITKGVSTVAKGLPELKKLLIEMAVKRAESIALTEAEAGAELTEAGASGAAASANGVQAASEMTLTKAISANIAALWAKHAALIVGIPVIAAMAAGLIALANAEKKSAEAIAENAKANADAAQKDYEAKKQIQEQTEELNKTLKENANSYDITDLVEYRNQAYELCKQYGDETLAVQTLTASYEELQNIMDQVSKANAENLKESAERAYQSKIAASAANQRANDATNTFLRQAGADIVNSFSNPFGILGNVVKTWRGDDSQAQERKQGFKLAGTTLGGFKNDMAQDDFKKLGVNIYDSGYMNSEQLLQAAVANPEELEKVLQKYKDSDWVGSVRKFLSTYESDIQEATEAYQEAKVDLVNSLVNETNIDAIQDAGAFEIRVQTMADQLLTATDAYGNHYFNTIEEAAEAAREQLRLVNEDFANYDNISRVAEQLDGAFKNSSAEDIAKELTGHTQTEIELIVAYTDPFGNTYDSIEELLEDKKDELKVLEAADVTIKTKTILEGDLSKGISDEQVASLYEDGTFEKVSGISQEEFLQKSTANRLTILQNYFQQYSVYAREHLDEMKATLTEEQAHYDEEIKKLEENYTRAQTLAENQKTALEDFNLSSILRGTENKEDAALAQQVDDIISTSAYGKEAFDELGKSFEKLKEQGLAEDEIVSTLLSDWLGLSEEQMTTLLNAYNKSGEVVSQTEATVKEYEEQVEAARTKTNQLAEKIANLESETEDLDVQIKIQIDSEVTKAALSDVKNLESSYKNLTSIMNEYNETGALSLGNLEQLLTMDDKYIASLDIQNGQMVMNEQAMQNQTMAYLDLLEATAYDEAMNELDAIAKGEATDAAWESVEANKAAAEGARAAGEAALAGSEGWEQYWASLEKARAADTKDSEATKNVEQALKNRLLMIQGMRDRIKSQGMAGLGGGSGSSAGSSGSESKKEAEHLDYLGREKDIYRTINAEISDIENTLDRIRKVDEHSWGASAQVAIEKESKELDALLKKYEQKKAMQERDLGNRRYQLEQRGVQFTADGSAMTNAEEWLDKKYAEYNAMVDKYNSMSAEEQEAYKGQLDKFKQDIDDVEKAMKDYESGFSDYQSTLNTLLEKHYEQIELAVKKFNNKINVELDLDNAKKTWEDFWYDVVQDVDDSDFIGKFEKSVTRMKDLLQGDSGMGIIGDITSHLNDTIAEVNKQIAGAANGGGDSMFGDDTALSKETLLQWRDSLIQYVTEAKQQLDALADNYLKVLDSAQDKIDEHIKGLEAITDHLDHNIKLIEMVSGTKAYDAFNKQYEKTYETNLKTIETQRMSKDYWADQMEHYKKLMDSVDKNSKAYKTYSEAYKKSVENYRQAVNDLDAAVENALEKLEEWHQKQLEEIQDKLEKGLTGTDVGLDTVEKEWQLINKWADQYYDNVERSINTEEYAHYLEQVANNTELTAESQKKLNEFRDEELKKLKEKENLTQYDIDESKARLAILQQEIALQDAQQQKNKMRLRRDSQGNYTYQYVGDDAAVEDAESKMFTAKKEWYALVKQRLKDVTEYSMELAKQQAELLKEIDEAVKNGETEKANLLRNLYNRNALEIAKFGKEVEKNQKDIYSGLNAYFSDVQNKEMIPQFESTAYQMAERFGEASTEVQNSISGAMTEVTQLLEDYGQRTKEILEQAGIDYNNMVENGIDPTTDALEGLVETNEDLADELDKVNETLREQEKELETMEELYNNLKDAAVKAIDEANKALETLSKTAIDSLKDVEAAIKTVNDARNQSSGSLDNGGSDGGSGRGGDDPGSDTTTTDKKKNSKTEMYYRYLESLPNGIERYGIYNKDKKFIKQVTFNPKDWGGVLSYLYKNGYPDSKYHFSRFKTGGYTGDWSDGSPLLDNGKLAVLHQKELVLNASDTQNLLDTVETLRNLQFDRLIENLNISANTPYELLSDLDRQIDAIQTTIAAQSPTFTGDVIINADFPNATDMDEIYQAFVELENVGMQAIYSNSPLQSISIVSGGSIYDRNYK